jgi:iron complex transport system ATP-binding protein
MLGRALAQDTPALILDEATAQLDYYNRERIFAILQKLASQKLIIFATHEVALALQYSQEVLHIQAPNQWQILPSHQAQALFR